MKKLLLKSMLLLCALVAGSLNGWAGSYTYNFTSGANGYYLDSELQNHPSSGNSNNLENFYASDGKLFVGSGNIYFSAASSGYLMAKSGCTLTLPTYSGEKITSISISNSSGCSTSTSVSIKSGSNTAASAQTWSTQGSTYNYTIGTDYQTTTLKVSVTSANAQITQIVITTASTTGKSDADLAFSNPKYATTYGESFTEPTLTNPHGLTVAYESSNTDVATINSSTGALTIKATGITTITASSEATSDYNAGNASYELHVFEHDGTTSAKAFTVSEAKEYIENGFYDSDSYYYVKGIVTPTASTLIYGSLRYYISDDGTATNQLYVYNGKDLSGADFTNETKLSDNEDVTVYGKMTTYSNNPQIANSYLYKRGDVISPTLTVNDIADMDATTEVAANTLYTTNSSGAVSFESSDETIAKVESNKLKALKPGTATITVNVAADAGNHYAAISKTFKVTVTSKPSVTPAGTVYSLVTDASTLSVGDKIILVSSKTNGSANAMGAQGASNRRGVAVTIANDVITDIPSVQVITLEKTGDKWNFNVGSGYLYATSSSANNIGTRDAREDANADATITIADGSATITFQGSYERNRMRYNPNGGSPIFSCYATTSSIGNLPFIFRLSTPVSYDVEIGSTGYKTLISAASATLPDGLTAYKAVSVSAGSIQLTPVASIKAGSAYILKGDAGNYTLTVTNTPEEPTGNILEVSTESSGNGCYVLANGSSGVGFYKWTGGSLGAGRAIVPASAVSTAREFLSFDFGDDTTGVNEIKTTQKADNQYFNLAGQRVAQPTKGLYIVNGKKVIIK